jgi:hypothetical protein
LTSDSSPGVRQWAVDAITGIKASIERQRQIEEEEGLAYLG